MLRLKFRCPMLTKAMCGLILNAACRGVQSSWRMRMPKAGDRGVSALPRVLRPRHQMLAELQLATGVAFDQDSMSDRVQCAAGSILEVVDPSLDLQMAAAGNSQSDARAGAATPCVVAPVLMLRLGWRTCDSGRRRWTVGGTRATVGQCAANG